jgi:hypothetical protein
MPSDPQRVQAVFLEAVDLPEADRAAFLDRACGTEGELRRRVELLLKAHDAPGSFLRQPAVDWAATSDSDQGQLDEAGGSQSTPSPGIQAAGGRHRRIVASPADVSNGAPERFECLGNAIGPEGVQRSLPFGSCTAP